MIACNTATAAAAAMLRERFSVPIVAMEPAVKPAVAATRSGVVGVLATVGTLDSARFAALLEQYAGDIEIVTQACPGLVEQIEAGELDSPATRALVERYTRPLLARGADTLVLGCTHFPFVQAADRVGRRAGRATHRHGRSGCAATRPQAGGRCRSRRPARRRGSASGARGDPIRGAANRREAMGRGDVVEPLPAGRSPPPLHD